MDNKIIILWLFPEFLFVLKGSFRKFNKLPAMSNLKTFTKTEIAPLASLDEWEEDVLKRYPEEQTTARAKEAFRNYEEPARDTVREFYRLNHTYQTNEFVQSKRNEFLEFSKKEMPVWDAFQFLNQLVDDSDPDTDLDQFQHLLQTAEAIRADGHPDWMVLVGLMHDMGKVLCLFGEPQWAVVGDTFPVGCAHSDKIVYPEFFAYNPDSANPALNSTLGVYTQNCGLRNVNMSWGHDEYVYQMMKNSLPEPGLYMLRYHSFYAWHREGAYEYLLDDHDLDMLKWVKLFNPYDLYSKNPVAPDWNKIKPYYETLVNKYLPSTLKF
jgi:inositol oxygenase